MSDVALLSGALARIDRACRLSGMVDTRTGVRLSAKQVRTLQQLDGDDPVMVSELADFLGVTASTMSLNLGRLESAGLVVRARDPADRRVMNVRLTPEGVRIRAAAEPFAPWRVAALLDEVWPSERARAVEGLLALADAADRVATDATDYLSRLAD